MPTPFHGGFGLINFQGLRKPSFYAYQFLNRLGTEELAASGENSWVTRGNGGMQILFWNYTPPATKQSNQSYFTRDLPSKESHTARIIIEGMPAGNYTLNVYRIGYGVNDVYTDYLKLGSPKTLTREQVKSLAERNDGKPISTTRVVLSASSLTVRDFPVRENDVYLITLSPTSRRY